MAYKLQNVHNLNAQAIQYHFNEKVAVLFQKHFKMTMCTFLIILKSKC